jgi:myosin-1
VQEDLLRYVKLQLTVPNISDLAPQRPNAVSKPKPAARPLPGQSTLAVATPTPVAKPTPTIKQQPALPSSAGSRPPPAPPRNIAPPPPPPPAQPETPMYRAKFAFEGQEGEMSLQKDDVVELVEKDDNGWWLVKKDRSEGWAPNNYLELVPPKAAPAPAPPPPPRRSAAPPAAPKSHASSVSTDVSSKPIAVFPGMDPSNGSATPWKKNPTTPIASAPGSRPSSSLDIKPPGPPIATKPKPPVAAKPAAPAPPKAPGKPMVPAAPRPSAAPTPAARPTGKPVSAVGQLDLSAAVSIQLTSGSPAF